jgi:aconitase A
MKSKRISITFINHQNKVFEFSNIILKDDYGIPVYSDSFVYSFLGKKFGKNNDYGKFNVLKKLSHDSNKASDSWNITNKFENKLKHEIFELEEKLDFLKKRLAAVQDTKSYITHVDSCPGNIEWPDNE